MGTELCREFTISSSEGSCFLFVGPRGKCVPTGCSDFLVLLLEAVTLLPHARPMLLHTCHIGQATMLYSHRPGGAAHHKLRVSTAEGTLAHGS